MLLSFRLVMPLEMLPQPLPWEIVTADMSRVEAGDAAEAYIGLPYGG